MRTLGCIFNQHLATLDWDKCGSLYFGIFFNEIWYISFVKIVGNPVHDLARPVLVWSY